MPKRYPSPDQDSSGFARFLRKYWIELAGGSVILVGILLAFLEWKRVTAALGAILTRLNQVPSTIQDFLTSRFSLLDVLGFFLVLLGMAFIIWRIRVRLDSSPARRLYKCPHCGSELYRIHRTPLDRLVGIWFFPHGRRYRCANESCRWSALLHEGVHRHRHPD